MYMYILKCSNSTYYTGSTKDLDRRILEHQSGEGANYTKKHFPVELVYFETFDRIDFAFYREKQVQNWSRKKKEALINGETNELKRLAKCENETSSFGFSTPLEDLSVNFDSRSSSDSREALNAKWNKRPFMRNRETKGHRAESRCPFVLSQETFSTRNSPIIKEIIFFFFPHKPTN